MKKILKIFFVYNKMVLRMYTIKFKKEVFVKITFTWQHTLLDNNVQTDYLQPHTSAQFGLNFNRHQDVQILQIGKTTNIV